MNWKVTVIVRRVSPRGGQSKVPKAVLVSLTVIPFAPSICSFYCSQNSASFILSVERAAPGRGSRALPPPRFRVSWQLNYPPPLDQAGVWMGLLEWRNRCLGLFRRMESHIRCHSPRPHCLHHLRRRNTRSHDYNYDITSLKDIIKTLTNRDVDAVVCSFEPAGHFP